MTQAVKNQQPVINQNVQTALEQLDTDIQKTQSNSQTDSLSKNTKLLDALKLIDPKENFAQFEQSPVEKNTDIVLRLQKLFGIDSIGETKDENLKRIKEGLNVIAEQWLSMNLAKDLIELDPYADQTDLNLTKQQFIFKIIIRSGLPSGMKQTLISHLEMNTDIPFFKQLFTIALIEGCKTPKQALSLTKMDEPETFKAGLQKLISFPADKRNLSLDATKELIDRAITFDDEEILQAGLSLANSSPIKKASRSELAMAFSKLMVKTENDPENEDNVITKPMLSVKMVAELLASGNPDSDDVKTFFLRCFGETTQQQHIDGIEALPMFDAIISADVFDSILKYSIKQFPHTIGNIVPILPQLTSLSQEQHDIYIQIAKDLISDPVSAFNNLDFKADADADYSNWQAFFAEGLMKYAFEIGTSNPSKQGELINFLMDIENKAVKTSVVERLGKIATNEPKAMEMIISSLESKDETLQFAAVGALEYFADTTEGAELLQKAVTMPLATNASFRTIKAYFTLNTNVDAKKTIIEKYLKNKENHGLAVLALARANFDETTTKQYLTTILKTKNPNALETVAKYANHLNIKNNYYLEIVQELLNQDEQIAITALQHLDMQKVPNAQLKKLLSGIIDSTEYSNEMKGFAIYTGSNSGIAAQTLNSWFDSYYANYQSMLESPEKINQEGAQKCLAYAALAAAQINMPYEKRQNIFEQYVKCQDPLIAAYGMNMIGAMPSADSERVCHFFREFLYNVIVDPNIEKSENNYPKYLEEAQQYATAETMKAIQLFVGNRSILEQEPSNTSDQKSDVKTSVISSQAEELLNKVIADGADKEAFTQLKSYLEQAQGPETSAILQKLYDHEATLQPSPEALEMAMKAHTPQKAAQSFDAASQIKIGRVRLNKNADPNRDLNLIPDLAKNKLVDVPTTVFNRNMVAEMWDLQIPLWLEGPTSAGKTAVIREICALTETPFRRFNLNARTDVDELIGKWVPKEDDPTDGVFQPGPVLQAAINGECLLLDEMDLANPKVLIALNNLLDERGEIQIMGFNKNQPFKPHANFRIFAATNGAKMGGGRVSFDPAWLRRWQKVQVSGLKQSEMETIVAEKYGKQIPATYVTQLCKFHHEASIAAEENMDRNTDTVAYSLRNLDKVCKRYIQFAEIHNLGTKKSKLAETILKRETQSLYLNGLVSEENRNLIKDLLDTNHNGISDKDVFDSFGLKENAEIPGTYLLEATDEGYRLGDIIIPAINNGTDMIPKGPDYVLTKRTALTLYEMAKASIMHEPFLLIGMADCGKSMLVEYFASLTGQNYYYSVLNENSEPNSIIGEYQPDGKFHPAPFIRAAMEKGIGFIDEINRAQPPIIERLNPAGDGEGTIMLTEWDGRPVTLDYPFTLIMAMNPPTYRNTNRLSMAFRNRLTTCVMGALDQKEELKLILSVLREHYNLPEEVTNAMVEFQDWFNQQLEDGSIGENDPDAIPKGMTALKRAMKYVGKYHEERGLKQALYDCFTTLYYQGDEDDMRIVERQAKLLSGL